ncbi:transcription repressor OFP13 [Mercurialis annua]|uniref:transcription repressor OFP13 n=1 Tax=Mercurialis annua TaxID=3986 RepID=UPI002160DE5D|nr:transcription repressor OFP13 [Mercurialis annua]
MKIKWSSCKHPKTHSFREDIYKTVNSVFFDQVETPRSGCTNSSETTTSLNISTDDQSEDNLDLEVIVRGARSERLFFEGGDTNSILDKAKPGEFPFKQSVVVAMESDDPYVDFKASMEEMLRSDDQHWDCLEELLIWYLKLNGKKNHGFILSAFIDLLLGIGSSSPHTTFSSALSSFSSSSFS